MASHTAIRSKHATLVAATVDTVTLAVDYDSVEIVNRDGVAAINVTVGSANSLPATPTVDGDDTYVLPAAIGAVQVTVPFPGATVVKLISGGTPKYTVTGVS